MPRPDIKKIDKKEDKLWRNCPFCSAVIYEVDIGRVHPYSLEQRCFSCGYRGPDMHFTKEEVDV